MKELVIKKCMSCGAVVKVIEDCNCPCGIECCGDKMITLKPNTTDAAAEKHVPTYEVAGDKIVVKVNHVMEEEHYIEWISMITDNKEYTVNFKAGEIAETTFDYVPGAKLYAYCNKHSLWSTDVK